MVEKINIFKTDFISTKDAPYNDTIKSDIKKTAKNGIKLHIRLTNSILFIVWWWFLLFASPDKYDKITFESNPGTNKITV